MAWENGRFLIEPFESRELVERRRREDSWKRVVARAKTRVRRKVMESSLDHLLTLTYRENFGIENFVTSKQHVEEFIRRVREKNPDWPFVAVLEIQKRGALHWHFGVAGWQDVRLLRDIWRAIIGENGLRGNIDVEAPRDSRRLRWGKLTLAYYMAKYIGKALGTGPLAGIPGSHLYKVSRGDRTHVEVVRITVEADAPLQVVVDHFAAEKFRLGEVWLGEQFGWLCSWKWSDVSRNRGVPPEKPPLNNASLPAGVDESGREG